MDQIHKELKRKSKQSLGADIRYANYLMRNNFPGNPGKDFQRKYVLALTYNPKKSKNQTMLLILSIKQKDGILKMKFQEVLPTYGYETFSNHWLDTNPDLRAAAHDAAVDYLVDEEILDPEEFDVEEAAYHHIDPLYGFPNNYINDIISTKAPEQFFFEDVQEHDQLQDFIDQDDWQIDEILIDYDLFEYLISLARNYNNKVVNAYIPGKSPSFISDLTEVMYLID